MRKAGIWIMVLIIAVATVAIYYVKNKDYQTESQSYDKTSEVSQESPEEVLQDITDSQLFVITRRTDQGSVTADVAFLNILKPEEKDLVFYVALNTHTVDLSSYNLSANAFISNSQKNNEQGFLWQPIENNGHHINGILRIKNDGLYNKEKTDFIELTLKNLAGEQDRKYRWEKTDWNN